MNKNIFIGILLIALIVLLVLLLGKQSQDQAQANRVDAVAGQTLSTNESEAVIEQAGRLIILPDEDPLFSVVVNASELRAEQPFYIDVENGDVVMVYPQTGKAFIYRPASDQIVNAGPLILQQQEPTENNSSTTVDTTTGVE